MLRHPHYLDVPWNIHWHGTPRHHHQLWWLIAILVLLAMFLMGVRAMSGIV
jgi:hypothetical protein